MGSGAGAGRPLVGGASMGKGPVAVAPPQPPQLPQMVRKIKCDSLLTNSFNCSSMKVLLLKCIGAMYVQNNSTRIEPYEYTMQLLFVVSFIADVKSRWSDRRSGELWRNVSPISTTTNLSKSNCARYNKKNVQGISPIFLKYHYTIIFLAAK